MSTTHIRGVPEGCDPQERLQAWLSTPPLVGENMTWVGKDYSLAQLKADVTHMLRFTHTGD